MFGGCLWWVSSRFLGLSPLRRNAPSLGPLPPLDRPPLDGPSAEPPRISLFFSLSRPKFHSFFPLWGVFSLNFGGVFEGRGAQMCTFGLWLSCEPLAASGPLARVILAYMCVKLLVRLYVGSILGPFWVHFGSILGPFWVHSGSILGPFWVHSGSILGPFWVHSGSILGPFCLLSEC